MPNCWRRAASTPNWPACSSTTEKKPRRSGVFRFLVDARSGGRDVRGLRALRALHDVETHTLAFLQRTEALRGDRRKMHEHVRAAVFGRDETEALGVVEPLHGTETHRPTPRVLLSERAATV